MDKEILACIKNEDIKYLHSGQISKYIFPMEREKAHKTKTSHLIIRIFVVAKKQDNHFHFLVQKRSSTKKTFPDYFTDSASGHVNFKANLKLKDIEQEAKRELEEEFGIASSSILKMRFYDLLTEENQKTIEISYVFIAQIPYNIELKPNPEELNVQESHFYTKSELLEIIENEKAIDYSKKIWKKLINSSLKEILNPSNGKDKDKKDKIAVFIGRFQPLHHGHLYLLKQILKDYEFLKIGIGSAQLSHTKTNPFTSKERTQFITNALNERNISKKSYQIYEIPDIFNANKWVSHVESIIGDFDILFSNSDWVRELFLKKGYKIGKKIELFKKKYNGAKIRKLIIKGDKKWRTLVPKEVANLIISFNGIERLKNLKLDKN